MIRHTAINQTCGSYHFNFLEIKKKERQKYKLHPISLITCHLGHVSFILVIN